MKTSNKLFIGLILFVVVTIFATFVYAKSLLEKNIVRIEKGSGKIEKVENNIEDFEHLVITDFFEVEYSKGDPEIVLNIDNNLQKFIEFNVDNKVLTLKVKDEFLISKNSFLDIRISSSKLKSISLFDEVKLFSDSGLEGDSLKIDMFGRSEVNASIQMEKLDLNAKSMAFATLNGEVQDLEMSLRDRCRIDAQLLKSNSAKVSASDYADCKIQVEDQLKAILRGNSILSYKGEPNLEKDMHKTASLETFE